MKRALQGHYETILLCESKVLHQPMLYLSLYFKTHRRTYYELLTRVRMEGDWEAWLDFFAQAVIETAGQAVDTVRRLEAAVQQDRSRIQALGRAGVSALRLHHELLSHPLATSQHLATKTGLTPMTVNKGLAHLSKLGIVHECTGHKRNRVFSYSAYLAILNEGTEPPGT